jgi:hypothetical protein
MIAGESKYGCFQRHLARCLFKVGDKVVFKKPKRNKIRGVVEHIETNISRIYWSEGGSSPRYIRVKIEQIDKATGEIKPTYVWACESRLLFGDMSNDEVAESQASV